MQPAHTQNCHFRAFLQHQCYFFQWFAFNRFVQKPHYYVSPDFFHSLLKAAKRCPDLHDFQKLVETASRTLLVASFFWLKTTIETMPSNL